MERSSIPSMRPDSVSAFMCFIFLCPWLCFTARCLPKVGNTDSERITRHVNGPGISGNVSEASAPRNMKILPPLPKNSVISVAPPPNRGTASLPFSFTALRPDAKAEEESVAELGNIAASYLDHLDRLGSDTPTLTSKYDSKAGNRYEKEITRNLRCDAYPPAPPENPNQESAPSRVTTGMCNSDVSRLTQGRGADNENIARHRGTYLYQELSL